MTSGSDATGLSLGYSLTPPQILNIFMCWVGKLKVSESDLLEQKHLGDVHPVSQTDSLWKPFV